MRHQNKKWSRGVSGVTKNQAILRSPHFVARDIALALRAPFFIISTYFITTTVAFAAVNEPVAERPSALAQVVSSNAESAGTEDLTPMGEGPRAREYIDKITQRLQKLETQNQIHQAAEQRQQWHTNLLLGLIAFLLGVVGLLIPLVTYFTSVLPGNRVVREARATLDGLDQRFIELASKHQNELVDTAIEKLKSDVDHTRQVGATFLALNSYHDFSERQVVEICAIARDAPRQLKSQLLHLVAGRESRYVTELIENLLSGQEGLHALGLVAQQWSATQDDRLYKKLLDWLCEHETEHIGSSSGIYIAMASPRLLTTILNDETFVGRLSLPQKRNILTSLRTIESQWDLSGLDGSLLAEEVEGNL